MPIKVGKGTPFSQEKFNLILPNCPSPDTTIRDGALPALCSLWTPFPSSMGKREREGGVAPLAFHTLKEEKTQRERKSDVVERGERNSR